MIELLSLSLNSRMDSRATSNKMSRDIRNPTDLHRYLILRDLQNPD